jgi:hypothetical protein
MTQHMTYRDYLYTATFEEQIIRRAMAQAAEDAGEPMYAIPGGPSPEEREANERFARLIGVVATTLDHIHGIPVGQSICAELTGAWCAFFIADGRSETGPWHGEYSPRLDRRRLRDLPDYEVASLLIGSFLDIPARTPADRFPLLGGDPVLV